MAVQEILEEQSEDLRNDISLLMVRNFVLTGEMTGRHQSLLRRALLKAVPPLKKSLYNPSDPRYIGALGAACYAHELYHVPRQIDTVPRLSLAALTILREDLEYELHDEL